MLSNIITAIAVSCIALLASFGIGFIVGLGTKDMKLLVARLREDLHDRDVIEAPVSAVADSSPQHLRAVRQERIRKGEDPEPDDGESQIITTKSPDKFRSEISEAKEAKLDAWMPGVKRAKN